MMIYNVTIKVDRSISTEWLNWLQEVHVPEIIETGCFTHATILRLLEIDDAEGPTFAIQYFAVSKANYNLYIEKYVGIMRQKSFDKWDNKFIAFRSVMQVIN